jgi:hypothetical protein
MAAQNLVSAAIAPESRADNLAKLADIRKQLDFLASPERGEAQALMRAGAYPFGSVLNPTPLSSRSPPNTRR